ncbi:MAG TPA: hypothetical protein VKD69_11500 [Vicinamibacterales bacterium]|nr:hypothetical protein [Vicinamibacterales bacterium]
MARELSFAVACALLLAGCNGNSTQGTVSSATQTRTTDTFSGTVQVGGSNFHSFPVAQTGTTDVTLTAASPPANVAMGLAVGTPGDGNCAPLAGAAQNVVAGPTPQITGLTTAGTFCVLVRDIGQATAPVSYTITVTHP